MKMNNGLCIDLGHGGKDPGAVGSKFEEAMLVLGIGQSLEKKLKTKGIKHRFTRLEDRYLTLQERCNIANNMGADLFLSIHINSATNKGAYGTEAWVYSLKNSKTIVDFGTWITNDLSKLLDTQNRGIKENKKFTILKNSKMMATILEVDFISNNVMEQRMKDNIENISQVIYEAIVKLYELPQDQQEAKYKVMIGAFANKDNAVRLLEEAKRKGFTDSYII